MANSQDMSDVTFTPPAQGQAAAPPTQDTGDVTFAPSTQKQDMTDVTFTPPGQAQQPDYLTRAEDIIQGGVTGFVKSLPFIGSRADASKAQQVGAGAAPVDPTAYKAGQVVGAGLETAGEWASGDVALAGLGKLAKVAQVAPEVLQLAEKYPKTARLIHDATLGAAIGAEKAPEEERAKGAVAGAVGAGVGSLAGEALEAITNSELAKAMMNRASGVTKAMIRYGQDPARALTSEDLPVFSTLTNRGRQAASQTKLNELKPVLDKQLQASPVQLDWRNVLGTTFADAKAEIQEIETMPDAAKNLAIHHIETLENNLAQKWASGRMNPFEMNELKARVQKFGADYDSKPDSSDLVRNFYNEVQGKLKDAVNAAVPGTKELNQRIADLTALKNASHETILAERAGIGPLSGFGTARKVEAAIGHAAPMIARTAKTVSKGAAPAVVTAGEALSPITQAQNQAAGRYYFMTDDGSIHSVPDTPEARQAVQSAAPTHTPLE